MLTDKVMGGWLPFVKPHYTSQPVERAGVTLPEGASPRGLWIVGGERKTRDDGHAHAQCGFRPQEPLRCEGVAQQHAFRIMEEKDSTSWASTIPIQEEPRTIVN